MIKTKQELLNHFSDINAMYNNPFEYQTLSNMIDELLEQQPCDDCISRADVLALAEKGTLVSNGNYKSVCKAINDLPSVTPKAEWKDIYAESEGSNSWIEFTCPHCGKAFGIESGQYGWSYGDAIPWKACPMCGGLVEHEPYKAESEG